MGQTVKVPLKLTPQPEGGYTVTSPLLPELITEGDTVAEVLANVPDALAAVVELYEDSDRPLPSQANVVPDKNTLEFETLLSIQGPIAKSPAGFAPWVRRGPSARRRLSPKMEKCGYGIRVCGPGLGQQRP